MEREPAVVREPSRIPVYPQDTDHHVPVMDVKEHWPNWAIYVVIVCILLTALAFLLGNCITKRTSPLRFKPTPQNQQPKNPGRKEDRRMWGAGFSGGLWAAA